MNTHSLDVIEQAIVMAQEAKRAEKEKLNAARVAQEAERQAVLEDAFQKILNHLVEYGVALRPYMSPPYYMPNVHFVRVDVRSVPGLVPFSITLDLYEPDVLQFGLVKEGGRVVKTQDALLYFRTCYEEMVLKAQKEVEEVYKHGIDGYRADYLRELGERIITYCDDLYPEFEQRLAAVVEAEKTAAAARVAYQQAIQDWNEEKERVAQRNVETLDRLQAEYDAPFRLYLLSYAFPSQNDDCEGTETAFVLGTEPDGEGWWKVLGNNDVRKQRFYSVVSVMEDVERVPSDAGKSLHFLVEGAGRYFRFRVNPYDYEFLPVIEATVYAALEPLPEKPQREAFGLEGDDDE